MFICLFLLLLLQKYKRLGQDPSVLYGFYYSISDEPRSKGEIFRITKIEADYFGGDLSIALSPKITLDLGEDYQRGKHWHR